MKVKNLNASSFKTKQLIRDKFAELLHEKKSIHRVSVSELTKRADIHRSTFYSHYDDIYQVAEDIKNEWQAFLRNKTVSKLEDIEPFFDEIYQYLKKDDEFFKLILSADDIAEFVRYLIIRSSEEIYHAMQNDSRIKDQHLLRLEVSTLFEGVAMQLCHYYRSDSDISLEDIIELEKILCQSMIVRRTSAQRIVCK